MTASESRASLHRPTPILLPPFPFTKEKGAPPSPAHGGRLGRGRHTAMVTCAVPAPSFRLQSGQSAHGPPHSGLRTSDFEPRTAAHDPRITTLPKRPSYENDTCDQLLDLARANAQAVIIGTAAFLEESGIPVEAWAHHLGEVFAGAWDRSVKLPPSEFLEAMLTNYRALGAEVLEVDHGRERAEATITGFPKRELGLELRIGTEPAAAWFHVPESLAADFGLRWSWSVDGERVRLQVARADGS